MADAGAPAPLVRRAVRAFVRAYEVDLSEALVPEQGFATFNEFFTRRLRPDARPLDPDPDAVLSPADGRLEDAGRIHADATLRIKGRDYGVVELLGDESAALDYQGGSFFVVYLSPRDYHRVHSAVSGPVDEVRHVPGTLYPVNAIGMAHIPRLLARNERVAVFQRSERHGRVASVMVGAIGVGRIGLSFDELRLNGKPGENGRRYPEGGPWLDRGDELGVFHLGSTVIVFAGPQVPLRFLKRAGDTVLMGQAVARKGSG